MHQSQPDQCGHVLTWVAIRSQHTLLRKSSHPRFGFGSPSLELPPNPAVGFLRPVLPTAGLSFSFHAYYSQIVGHGEYRVLTWIFRNRNVVTHENGNVTVPGLVASVPFLNWLEWCHEYLRRFSIESEFQEFSSEPSDAANSRK